MCPTGYRREDMEVSSIPGRYGSALELLETPRHEEAAARVAVSVVSAAPESDRARRLLNIALAALLLLISTPLMLVIAALIKLTSSGPVLFVQSRVGLDRRNGGRPTGNCRRRVDSGGKPFRMYKFRTMRSDGGNGDQVWAKPDDPRVTPVGRVLRKYRLDELPQLLNVLRGDMNVVGPRPEQPDIFAHLRQEIDRYAERQRVRPGITGWAQVNHHYDRTADDVRRKLHLDLDYIERESVREDLRIILRTVPTVVFKQGAW
jgi:lipopolysaccharide/colanic/teichoic acid biosynthesis glycosyltransferase